MKRKIYVIGAQHGDERFGLKVLGHLQRLSDHNLSLRVGHPEAVAKGVRFLETDMNRSYGFANAQTIEQQLANSIEADIRSFSPEVIVDLHTSRSNVDKVGIIAENSEYLARIAELLGMTDVVVMNESLLKGSLLDTFRSNSISLEFGKNNRSDKLAKDTADKLRNLQSVDLLARRKISIPVYQVVGEIEKNYKGLDGIQNLKFDKELDGYPFLAGPDTYETIGGFLTHRI